MGPVLNGLIKLQEVESRLRGVKQKLARTRRGLTLQENQLRNIQNTLESKKDEAKLIRNKIDKIELEMQIRDEALKKRQEELNNAKNNKEYSALLTEINVNKADNSKKENELLELMAALENEQEESKQIESQIEKQSQKIEQVREQVNVKAKDIQESLSKLQNEWDEASRGIPNEVLELFRRLSDNYDGEALAYVDSTGGKRRNYTCGGCFMSLTNETVNQLLSNDDIIRCPSCSRIVVLHQDKED
ncbi:Putative zinc ribbon domain protein [Limihaloglobus sulfuriphilus]|uniref:Putative zinc ribbon domain protein n=1 Tax=Limihaloglobus sulfuriphilus TaxID=1851148 RepID=A0A1Q2MDP1_9BACT|nr:C4-type zinc ribbon domain-containing protein [Limihaloglobus sulfuriphilus]AQQ70823.1 Putative zinc ribbon domain protein [Limihaloglobus sulfuriphilus]